MSKVLNFNTVKKQYLTVTLSDENKTTIMIGTPTKKVMNDLVELQSALENYSEGEVNSDTLDILYDACAKIMSQNKGGIDISKDLLEEIFDIEDILIFFNGYMSFVRELSSSKN